MGVTIIWSCQFSLFIMFNSRPLPRATGMHRGIITAILFAYANATGSWGADRENVGCYELSCNTRISYTSPRIVVIYARLTEHIRPHFLDEYKQYLYKMPTSIKTVISHAFNGVIYLLISVKVITQSMFCVLPSVATSLYCDVIMGFHR